MHVIPCTAGDSVCVPGTDSALDPSLRKIMRALVFGPSAPLQSHQDQCVICLGWRINRKKKETQADSAAGFTQRPRQTERQTGRQAGRQAGGWVGFKSRLISAAFLSLLEFLGGLVACS